MIRTFNNATVTFMTFGLILTSNALADSSQFVYDDKKMKDPFIPLVTTTGSLVTSDSDLTVGDLILEGIVADDKGQNAAIINGKIVAAGDTVGNYTIDSIEVDQVNLINNGQVSVLKLKKEAF